MTRVSIHAPARGATPRSKYGNHPFLFQSTHPHGVRLQTSFSVQSRIGVSIHAPARGATLARRAHLRCVVCFNPRTRTGCDRCIDIRIGKIICFNPRTRTGCDLGLFKRSFDLLSFNPRTRTGCDLKGQRPCRPITCFNPRTRTGCDSKSLKYECSKKVSIHAPARGATSYEFQICNKSSCFNPRTRTGCDVKEAVCTGTVRVFQSTHPHGVRH